MYLVLRAAKIKNEHVPKLELMLKSRLKAEDVVIRKLHDRYFFSFKVDNSRKAFAFDKAVSNYGGTVAERWIQEI